MKYLKANWVAILYTAIYFLIVVSVLLNRFWQFEAYYFDHGIFDGALWQVAHFQAPMIDHLNDRLMNQFGDHFTPSLYLLAPIYFFTSAYEAILIAEALLVAGSVYVVYLFAKLKVKSRVAILAIVVAYSFFIGLQNMIIANLHSEIIAIFTLGPTLLFMEQKRWKLFWLMLILTLGAKENFVTIGLGLSIYLFFAKEKKQSIMVAVFSLFYYLAVTRLLIPHISGEAYQYEIGASNPGDYLINFISPQIKVETMMASFATFGFLPVLVPSFLPAIGQDFFGRFVLNGGSSRWDLGLHYNATLAVLLAFGATLGAHRLELWKLKKVLVALSLLSLFMTALYHRFLYHGPLALAVNPAFYGHTKDLEFLRSFLNKVPPGGTIMTQNHLAPHLTHQAAVMLPRDYYDSYKFDAIVLDIRPDQNPNAFWPMRKEAMLKMVKKLSKDKNYKQINISDTQILFERVKKK